MKAKTAKRYMNKNAWKMARRKRMGRRGKNNMTRRWKTATAVLVAAKG